MRRNAGSLPASESDHSASAEPHTADRTQAGSLRSDAVTPLPTFAQLTAENDALKKQLQEQTRTSSLKDKLKQAGARTPKLLLDAAKGSAAIHGRRRIETPSRSSRP